MTPRKLDSIQTFTPGADTPLLEYLFTVLTMHKRTAVKAMLKYGQIKVGDEVVTQFNHPVAAGTPVSVNFSRPFVTFYNRRLKLVYEDEHIIVANKGYGLL